MTYKTRPYWGLPFVPNLTQQYKVANGHITKTKFPGQTVEMKISAASTIKINRGKFPASLLRTIIKTGDVEITTTAGTEEFDKIWFPENFVRAVNNEIYLINNPFDPNQKTQPPENVEYEDFLVSIPRVPKVIDDLVYRLQYLNQGHFHSTKAGDFVRKGSPILETCGLSIVMPFDGVIEELGELSSSNSWDNAKETPLVILKPIRGSDTSHATGKAYSNGLSYLDDMLKSKRHRSQMTNGKSHDVNEPIFVNLKKAMNQIKSAETQYIETPTSPTETKSEPSAP